MLRFKEENMKKSFMLPLALSVTMGFGSQEVLQPLSLKDLKRVGAVGDSDRAAKRQQVENVKFVDVIDSRKIDVNRLCLEMSELFDSYGVDFYDNNQCIFESLSSECLDKKCDILEKIVETCKSKNDYATLKNVWNYCLLCISDGAIYSDFDTYNIDNPNFDGFVKLYKTKISKILEMLK